MTTVMGAQASGDHVDPVDVIEFADTSEPRPRAVRLLLRRPSTVASILYLGLLVTIAVFATQVSPSTPQAQELTNRLLDPSAAHLLGTDELGRDVLSRMIHASRLALLAPAISVGVASALAIPTGLWAGLERGIADAVLGRVADTLLGLPGLAFALAIIAVLGPGLVNAMLALGVIFSPRLFRVVRGATIGVARNSYIDAARSIGCSRLRIVVSHVLPNIAAPVLVQVTVLMGIALIAEASLSFIGIGVQPPDASWGSMLADAYRHQFTHPFGVFPPGVALVLTVLAFNTIGDAVRDVVVGRSRR